MSGSISGICSLQDEILSISSRGGFGCLFTEGVARLSPGRFTFLSPGRVACLAIVGFYRFSTVLFDRFSIKERLARFNFCWCLARFIFSSIRSCRVIPAPFFWTAKYNRAAYASIAWILAVPLICALTRPAFSYSGSLDQSVY